MEIKTKISVGSTNNTRRNNRNDNKKNGNNNGINKNNKFNNTNNNIKRGNDLRDCCFLNAGNRHMDALIECSASTLQSAENQRVQADYKAVMQVLLNSDKPAA
jgi:hypothetical protein